VLASILWTGLAIGAIYALIAVTYNVMFSASRVMSFTDLLPENWAVQS
jgi:branched-chain amino acid transport system permease protein